MKLERIDSIYEKSLAYLQEKIINCKKCLRLVKWRQKIAKEKVKRYIDQKYWGRPVPSFGDFNAKLLIVGLAPAAHGGNRTGRIFTGDRSGDWLYRALYNSGFSNQSRSVHRNDGLELKDCYITASLHCAPPGNKPLADELDRCREYLLSEIKMLKKVCVIVALGQVAFKSVIDAFKELKLAPVSKHPRFGHLAEYKLNEKTVLIASFHPSQQNTFTGRLTEKMFDAVFSRARELINHEKK